MKLILMWDANAGNQIQGFYVQCFLHFKQEWQFFIVGQGKECTYLYFHIYIDFSYVSRHYVNILSITLKFFLAPNFV